MRQIHFYAVKDDLLSVFDAVERTNRLKYIRMGVFSSPAYECFFQGAQIPNLGRASADSASSAQAFLVSGRDVPLNLRSIRVGVVERYAVDQLVNPDTVTLAPGGIWGEDIVLSGRVGTVSDSTPAKELMKCFRSAFKKHFRTMKAYCIGPNALELFRTGARLTASARSPREYDLSND